MSIIMQRNSNGVLETQIVDDSYVDEWEATGWFVPFNVPDIGSPVTAIMRDIIAALSSPTSAAYQAVASLTAASVANLVQGAPQTLNTLQELANAISNDPTFGADTLAQINTLASQLAAKAPLLAVAPTVTSNATLAASTHTPVDATNGPVTMALPTGQSKGSLVTVEKLDGTTNAVTVSGSIRGAAGTINLVLAHETVAFLADINGSWWPLVGHKTLSSLQAIFAPLSGAGSPAAALTTATGQAVAFSIALGG